MHSSLKNHMYIRYDYFRLFFENCSLNQIFDIDNILNNMEDTTDKDINKSIEVEII